MGFELITGFSGLFDTVYDYTLRFTITYTSVHRVAQALGSLSVASYDLQGYCGGIRTHLHAGMTATANWSWLLHLGMDHKENISSIIAMFSRCYGNMLVCRAVT
jgi:hypothetical protein